MLTPELAECETDAELAELATEAADLTVEEGSVVLTDSAAPATSRSPVEGLTMRGILTRGRVRRVGAKGARGDWRDRKERVFNECGVD
jgi:hypothetical protein